MPALSSSLISPALRQLTCLPAGDRELLAGGHVSLLEHLARVPDPRDPRGVRHSLCSLLAAAVAAVVAGSRSFAAIGEWVADAPPHVLASLGIRRDPLTRRFEPPDEATIRRVLESVDAGLFDQAAGAWLSARCTRPGRGEVGARRRAALAVDGKAVRGTRHASADGQAVHLMAVLDQQACAVLGQVDVDGKTNEVTRFRPLLAGLDLTGCVVTADAMHTQRDHAEFLVQEKNAHYIFIVKKNQPGLYAQVKNLPWRQIPAWRQATRPGPRPRRTPHTQSRHRRRRAGLPPRGPGHRRHPPDPPANQREVADRHRLRDHQPDRQPSQRRPARGMDPRPLAHRGPAPHPRRHLRRGLLPDPHRQRPPGHGHPAEPGHRHLETRRSGQHRRRHPAPRPGPRQNPGHPRAHPGMTKRALRHYAGPCAATAVRAVMRAAAGGCQDVSAVALSCSSVLAMARWSCPFRRVRTSATRIHRGIHLTS